MKIIFVTPYVSQTAGGLFTSVRLLAQKLSIKHEVEVFALEDDRGKSDFHEWQPIVPRLFKIFPQTFGYGFSVPLVRALARAQPDILHVHGIRMWPATAARIVAQKKKIPLVISPRGQLNEWPMERNRLRKKLMHFLFEDTNIRSTTFIHATCEAEKQYIYNLGFNQPVEIIPNGVSCSEFDTFDSSSVFSKWPILKNKKVLLFLSNVHPRKGLDLLAPAWEKLRKKHSGWILAIAGTGESQYYEKVKNLYRDGANDNQVVFLGDVRGNEKIALYRLCELFILPTHSENFGNVIAEAMAACKPVITTKGTPWSCLADLKSGWWIDYDTQAIQQALKTAMCLSDEERIEMGQRGRQYVEKHLSWDILADNLASMYEKYI